MIISALYSGAQNAFYSDYGKSFVFYSEIVAKIVSNLGYEMLAKGAKRIPWADDEDRRIFDDYVEAFKCERKSVEGILKNASRQIRFEGLIEKHFGEGILLEGMFLSFDGRVMNEQGYSYCNVVLCGSFRDVSIGVLSPTNFDVDDVYLFNENPKDLFFKLNNKSFHDNAINFGDDYHKVTGRDVYIAYNE